MRFKNDTDSYREKNDKVFERRFYLNCFRANVLNFRIRFHSEHTRSMGKTTTTTIINNRRFKAEVPNCRTAKDYRLRQGVKRNYVRGLAQMFNATADNAGCRYPRSDTNLPYPIDPVLRSTVVLYYYYYDAHPESASRSQRKSTPIFWRFSMKYKFDIFVMSTSLYWLLIQSQAWPRPT